MIPMAQKDRDVSWFLWINNTDSSDQEVIALISLQEWFLVSHLVPSY